VTAARRAGAGGRSRRSDSLPRVRVLVITWAPGGNLLPMLAVASALDRRGHEVMVLASGETRGAAEQLGFQATAYRRSPDPDLRIAFEEQADLVMARMAGPEIALDARDVLDELRPDLAIVDCMLPAAIAAARATGTPTVSLVHFLYGLARTQMLKAGGGWTTDLRSLAATHRMLGLAPARDGLAVWEASELVLITAPRWLDIDCDAPANVVHAGPLGVAGGPPPPDGADVQRRRVLVTFSSTVIGGQTALINRVCEAVVGLDLDPVLTLGPAVDRDAVRIPDGVEVLDFGDHDSLMAGSSAVIGHGGLGTVLRASPTACRSCCYRSGATRASTVAASSSSTSACNSPPMHHRSESGPPCAHSWPTGDSQRRPPSWPGGSLPTGPTGRLPRRSNKPPREGDNSHRPRRPGPGAEVAQSPSDFGASAARESYTPSSHPPDTRAPPRTTVPHIARQSDSAATKSRARASHNAHGGALAPARKTQYLLALAVR
jgi:UDP:flavonoid glycosyltransferase YjiC (YdhE family)